MKRVFFIACLTILAACNDPYELTQQEFEKIYKDTSHSKVVYFNQEMTIAFVCDKNKIEQKTNGFTSCTGRRKYIKVANLTNETKDIVLEDLKKKLSTSRHKIDIQQLIKKVAELTNKTFVADPGVHGKVPTLKSTDPGKVFNEFSSVLKAYNYTLTDRDGFILIEPKAGSH